MLHVCRNEFKNTPDRLRTDLNSKNETDILADSLESFVTLTYAEKEHKMNASYSDWIDTKDNDLLILYEPSKANSGKD